MSTSAPSRSPLASPAPTRAREMVDLAFALEGGSLPGEHGFELQKAVVRALPWLEAEEQAGIHPVRASHGNAGTLIITRRTRLVLRLPADRVCAATALEERELPVGDFALKIGTAQVRPLQPFPTLYAHRVVAEDPDEVAFLAWAQESLQALGVRCELICGRRRTLGAGGRELAAYGLALHGLRPEPSLAVQRAGLGAGRQWGCGIFIPHKTIAFTD